MLTCFPRGLYSYSCRARQSKASYYKLDIKSKPTFFYCLFGSEINRENTINIQQMILNTLQLKRAVNVVLFFLLLSAVGMTKAFAQSFTVGNHDFKASATQETQTQKVASVNGMSTTAAVSMADQSLLEDALKEEQIRNSKQTADPSFGLAGKVQHQAYNVRNDKGESSQAMFQMSGTDFYQFTLNAPANATPYGTSYSDFCNGAEYYLGQYYVSSNGGAFLQLDPASGAVTTVATGNAFQSIAYNPADGQMYGLALGYNPDLYIVDVTTGTGTMLTAVNTSAFLLGLDIDNTGRMFVIDADINGISEIDINGNILSSLPAGFTVNYGQDLSTDRETNETYWAAFNADAFAAQLYKYDYDAGEFTLIGTFYDHASAFATATVSNPNLPAGPTDLTLTKNGDELVVYMTWTNPTTTMGGDPLDNVSLYVKRNGEIIATFENVTLGGDMSYVDDAVPGPGTYAYSVQSFNEEGLGGSVGGSILVGAMCVYHVDMQDSWGDGWNGGAIHITDEGGNLLASVTLASGSSGSADVTIPTGQYINMVWVQGSYDSEVSFQFYYPWNELLYEASAPNAGILISWNNTCVPPTCPRPTNLTGEIVDYNNVYLSWDDPAGCDAIYIYYGDDREPFVILEPGEEEYLDENLKPGEYSYNVRAHYPDGCVSMSESTLTFECVQPYRLVEGHVYSTMDNSDIAGATITFVGTTPWGARTVVATSDEEGMYSVDVFDGTYTVTAVAAGFNVYVVNNYTIEPFGPYTLNFPMEQPAPHTVTATVNPVGAGTVTGAGEYEEGETATLRATAVSGYDFVNWTEDGTEVSTDATYSFVVTGNRDLVANFAPSTNILSIGDYTGAEGEILTIDINLANEDEVSGFQFDIPINEGFTYVEGSIAKGERCGPNFILISQIVSSGALRVLCYSMPGTNISSNYGTIASLQILLGEAGTYELGLENCVLQTITGGILPVIGLGGTLTISGSHEYIDLGLPSGLLWATCNVGANAPEEYGDYFAWGETQTKGHYGWSTYQYCNGDYNQLTKYCSNPDYGYNGYTDTLTILLPEDDAATVNWGDEWRMPTKEEFEELFNNTTVTWTQQNGVNGRLFTASNGNSLFLPATGYWWEGALYYHGNEGHYWSSLLYSESPNGAWVVDFTSSFYSMGNSNGGRGNGVTVRPVRASVYTITATASPEEGGTIEGAGSYAEGSTCTLMATANEGYTFFNWTENGEVVSTDATYSFVVTGNRDLVANFAPSTNILSIGDYTGAEGEILTIDINLANEDEVSGFQFDIPINEGFTYVEGSIAKGERCGPNFILISQIVSSGALRVLCYSMPGTNISSNYGTIASLQILLGEAGTYELGLENCVLNNIQGFNPPCIGINGSLTVEVGTGVTFDVTVTANPAEGGTIEGAGSYAEGTTCTLTATANAGYTFINWTENGEEVSTEDEYSFTVTGDRDLVANFIQENPFIPTEDLVAYYPFDGDVNDYSGNGNHGTIIGNVVPATDRHGNPNGAYRFPGEAFNYISVPDAEILHLNAFTLSAWVYTDADNYGSGYLINKGRDIDNGSYRLNVTGVGAQTQYGGNNGVGIENIPEVNQWHMITGTVEGDQARFYVDGVLQSEGTLSQPFSYGNSQPLTLGCHYYNGVPSYWAYTLLGVMDEVRIYSRVLTPQEVMQLYTIDNGCLPGAFSVAEGSYVNFSRGNLQYQANTDTWRFAENQWDCVGPDNANISETYDGWIDLFGWGTSGYNHGAVCYQPWSTSTNNSDYWAYGDSGASLSDQTGQADWGYNAISNGGNQEGLWHTLSRVEWDYLVNTRPCSTLNGVENARHAKAMVNGIAGLILFPDHYTHPEGVALPVNINAYASLFTDNEYTIEQWYDMEAAGAVFLPSAGSRDNTSVGGFGTNGLYWSTTPSSSAFTHRFDFSSEFVVAWGRDGKHLGYSVRLVKNVLTTTCSIEATPNPIEGGTVTGAGTYFVSETCTLTAIPNEGYTFINWTENGEVVSTDATYSFTVTTDRDLVANFTLPFSITASANPVEGGTISGAGEYDYNSTCTLTAIPNEDYIFVNWTNDENVVSTQASYSFVVTEDADYVAHFSLKLVGTVMAEYDPDPSDNQSPYVRVSWSRDSNMQENFESGDFNMHAWEFPDSYPWIITDNNPYEGNYCMKSNNGGAHSTASSIQTTMFIPWEGQMSFWSRISSEGNWDYGRFYIDGQEMGNWSGNGGWQQHTYDITAGEHTFKWAYTKDGSVSSNEDCFYVDNINFVSGARGARAVHHYEVYRSEHPENGSWELLADNVSDTTYVDTDWSALAEGWYKYGVAAYYEGFDTIYPTNMARSNRILRAYPHTITATANPEEGGTITGAGDYVLYTECTLTALPNDNYTFINWTENGEVVSTDATYSFTVTTDRDLVANFTLPISITATVEPAEGGTVSGAGEYDYGTECTLTALPNEDYYFSRWTENGTEISRNSTYSFTVTTERDLVANFVLKPVCMVSATYDPDPDDNQSPYVRVSWSRDSNIMQENFESGNFNMHEWEFPDSYPWIITDNNPYEGNYCMKSNNGGAHSTASSIQTTMFIPWEGQMSFWSRISSEGSYDYGRFYIDGQQLGAWSGNGGWEQHTYDISAGEHTFKWAYTKDYSVNSNEDCFYVDNICFVSGARGDRAVHHYEVYRSEYPENGSWELIADNVSDTTYVDTDWSALAEGWYKYGVAAYYEGFDTIYPTNMARSNRILRAYPHTITATANPEEGGTITGAGDYVLYTECTLTALPNDNYTFINWTENDEVVSTDATYSFTVTTDRDLVANFTLPFTITVSAVPEEGGTVTGAGEYVFGTECTLTATANEGYDFIYWTENGAMVSSNTTYSFTVTADRTFAAYFAENTQTISFSSEWTWISTYIEQEGIDGLAILEEGLNPNGVMIKSQNDGFLFYDAGLWIGTLDAITNEKMYLVNVTAPSEVVMTGPIAHPTDHPITLNPNWTWIGYPSPFEIDVNDALANLNATEGDILKSQSSFSTYSTEYGWFGSLNTLTPGIGLMYQSHNSQAITLTYSVGMSRSMKANVTAENNHWVPNIHSYPNNMSIIAVVELDGEELQDERYELAVFSGDEFRGSARLVYVEAMHRYVAFLSVAGDEEAELYLALYDSATGDAYFNTKDYLNFESNAVLGSIHSPFVARFGSHTELDEFGDETVILYPNPVPAGHVFQLVLPTESKGARVSIINTFGSVISTTDLYDKPATLRAPDVPGVYMVRVVTGKQGIYCRKLIVN